MVDLLFLTGISIFFGIILVAMGLSFLSQSLNSLDYTNTWQGSTATEYYNNPLFRLNSKWFHYRPKGSVILSKKQWDEIERSIGAKINEAKEEGKALGHNAAIIEIQDRVKEEQASIVPNTPYKILAVTPDTPLNDVEDRYKALKVMYDPKNFVDLDKAFVELAEIRTDQIVKAWRKIKLGTFTS